MSTGHAEDPRVRPAVLRMARRLVEHRGLSHTEAMAEALKAAYRHDHREKKKRRG